MTKLTYDMPNGNTNVINWYEGWLKNQGVKKAKRLTLIEKTGIDPDMTFSDIADLIMKGEIVLSRGTKTLFLQVISSAMQLSVNKYGSSWDEQYFEEEELENLYYSTSIVYN